MITILHIDDRTYLIKECVESEHLLSNPSVLEQPL